MAEDAHLKIVTESIKYMDWETPVGDLIFKMVMKKFIIDTFSKEHHIRENLTNLDTYMSTVDSNIESFNKYVR